MWDTCNQFVDIALKGGLLTLVCYIAILARSFGAIGTARKLVSGNQSQEWLLWCLGSALFATVVASFGINYMVQLQMELFSLLACISASSFGARQVTVPSLEAPGLGELPSVSGAAETHLSLREVR